ncbi:lipid-A-disaccharide synthase [Rhodovulum visakhapatnamense]|uniref:Lipid-A-disaccharide synthase n=1 Tax=Rhodovulum visakhapatnamense TaxID=364297 RepID=A0A4R8FZR2_9RHOB|nr:lipid-A-disaccharide synthase [Rhodovulum visakhapatnamense]TDX32657.1 lipid-A-disaccharide synthase [Rhodovulum visakhapatnamense]
MTRLFFIAGEPSGDALGAALIAGLKELDPGLEVHGVGGPLMQAEGLESLFPMDELSVMGIAEVLPRYAALMRRIKECAAEVVRLSPDALVTIDSPDFCLRVARRVKAQSPVRTVHYVAPTVWAWRPGRAARMAEAIDQVLALFPFEPPYMEAAGMRCDFVGHPVVAQPRASDQEARAFRDRHGIAADAPLCLVLPGSRAGEVDRLAPVFGTALQTVASQHPGLRVVVPTTAGVAERVAGLTAAWPGAPVLIDPRADGTAAAAAKRAAFAAADLALAASGTVSLELAASETPMVIAYDMNWLSRQIIWRMVRLDTVTLVNIVSETRAVPEFLGEACQPGPIAAALCLLLEDPAYRAPQIEAMRVTMDRLGQGGEAPGRRAARAVLDGLATARRN